MWVALYTAHLSAVRTMATFNRSSECAVFLSAYLTIQHQMVFKFSNRWAGRCVFNCECYSEGDAHGYDNDYQDAGNERGEGAGTLPHLHALCACRGHCSGEEVGC
jgi:hypothetical protein